VTTTEGQPPTATGAPTGDVLARLDALLALAADFVVLLDGDGALQLAYPPGVLGYPVGGNIGRAVFDFLHPDDRESAAARFASVLETPRGTVAQECRVGAADGSWRWMELTGINLLEDPSVCGIVVRGRDITDEREAKDALQESEQRFKALVQHASDLLIVFDKTGQLTYSSPATTRFVFGPGAGELHIRRTRAVVRGSSR
jgi:PAS domain S-box-containing protein